jgi:uncharacterized repeat protein (TIGR01451 family)
MSTSARSLRIPASSRLGRRLPRARTALAALALVATLCAAALPAAAQAPSSSAVGESIDLRLVPLLGGGIPVHSAPQAFASGSAPPAYDVAASRLSLTVGTPLTGTVLTTSLLNAHAASSGTPPSGAAADASVHRANLTLVGALPLLTLAAEEIRSSAALSGPCAGTPTPAGSTTLVNLRLGGSLGAGLAVNGAVAPNTVLLDLAGIRVVLNEQISTTSGATTRFTVNAVHVSARGAVTALGVLSGDVILSQSSAQLGCSEADLALAKTSDLSSASPGQPFHFFLTVTNNGPGTAHGVQVSDPLPAGLTLIDATPSQGSCSGTSTVVCDLGDLAAGDQATVDLTVSGGSPGDVTNTAQVTSATADSDTSNNQASATVTIASGPTS